MDKVIVITGQTATGKTNLALVLAQKFNGELINCDSRQVYKKLDIITGKDLPKKAKFIKQTKLHNFNIGYYPFTTKIWLYDIVDPKQHFSSFDYTQCAKYVINNIFKRGKTPIIIGGTGLYLKHLLYGFDNNIPPNWKLRKHLENKTIEELQRILQQFNNSAIKYLNNSDINNPRRLIRRIEILSSPEISNHPNLPNIPNLPIDYIGLKFKKKEDLIKKIKERVQKRLDQGAIKEVESLLNRKYSENDPGLKTIGYPQIIKYLKKKLSKDEMVNQWIIKETQYAKRQYTYLKKYFNINWKEL